MGKLKQAAIVAQETAEFMPTIREYLSLDERERAAYMAGNYDLAYALQQIETLEREISRLQYLLTDHGVNYAQNDD